MLREKGKKLLNTCFHGEVTVPKTTCWLVGAVCLLAGIVHGMRVAPLTHGFIIGSGNGNHIFAGEEEPQEEGGQKEA